MINSNEHGWRHILALAALVAMSWTEPAPAAAGDASEAAFGSLKTDRVEVRKAPSWAEPVTFAFNRAGMPVRLLDSRDGWRRVEDSEGAGGWVPDDLVSRRRTAVVVPVAGRAEGRVAIRSSESRSSSSLAYLEAGVIVGIIGCSRGSCNVSAANLHGFVEQDELWGAGSDR